MSIFPGNLSISPNIYLKMFGYPEELLGYEFCRITIYYKQQGKGYGKQALLLIFKEMTKLYKWDKIFLIFLPENTIAIKTLRVCRRI